MADPAVCIPCMQCAAAKTALADLEQAKFEFKFAKAAYSEDADRPKEIKPDGKDGPVYAEATPEELAELNLDPETLKLDGTNFRAVVYKSGEDFIVAFQGTDPTKLSDIKADAQQALGFENEYYTRAQEIGKRIKNSPASSKVKFVGHSLGGGLAEATAAINGSPATTFNGAGLHEDTVPDAVRGKITSVQVKGEILSTVQKYTPLPDAYGKVIALDPPATVASTIINIIGAAAAYTAVSSGPAALLGSAFALAKAVRGVILHLSAAIDESLDKAIAAAAEEAAEKCGAAEAPVPLRML